MKHLLILCITLLLASCGQENDSSNSRKNSSNKIMDSGYAGNSYVPNTIGSNSGDTLSNAEIKKAVQENFGSDTGMELLIAQMLQAEANGDAEKGIDSVKQLLTKLMNAGLLNAAYSEEKEQAIQQAIQDIRAKLAQIKPGGGLKLLKSVLGEVIGIVKKLLGHFLKISL